MDTMYQYRTMPSDRMPEVDPFSYQYNSLKDSNAPNFGFAEMEENFITNTVSTPTHCFEDFSQYKYFLKFLLYYVSFGLYSVICYHILTIICGFKDLSPRAFGIIVGMCILMTCGCVILDSAYNFLVYANSKYEPSFLTNSFLGLLCQSGCYGIFTFCWLSLWMFTLMYPSGTFSFDLIAVVLPIITILRICGRLILITLIRFQLNGHHSENLFTTLISSIKDFYGESDPFRKYSQRSNNQNTTNWSTETDLYEIEREYRIEENQEEQINWSCGIPNYLIDCLFIFLDSILSVVLIAIGCICIGQWNTGLYLFSHGILFSFNFTNSYLFRLFFSHLIQWIHSETDSLANTQIETADLVSTVQNSKSSYQEGGKIVQKIGISEKFLKRFHENQENMQFSNISTNSQNNCCENAMYHNSLS